MAMTGAVASQLIHKVIIDKIELGFLGKLAVKNMRVFLIKPNFAGSSSTCWWALCDTPTKASTVQLRVLSECVVKLFGMHVSIDPTPTAKGSFAPAIETLQDLADRETSVGAIETTLSGAWKAGVWSAVKDTDLEFPIAIDKFKCGGAAHFVEMADSIEINLFYQASKADFQTFLEHCERQRDSEQITYTMELCTPGTQTIRYLYKPRQNSLKAA